MKTRVINLVGASGSGKTTVAKELEKTGCNIIQSYTTRPPREDGEWGHTFIEEYTISQRENNEFRFNFRRINSLGFLNIASSKDMIAYFNSYKSVHHYFATDEQVIRDKTNIYIVDSKGAEMVHEFYKDLDVEVITVYLHADYETRQYRMHKDKTRVVADIWDRLNSDDQVFNLVKCDYVVDGNQDIDTVVNSIRDVIRG